MRHAATFWRSLWTVVFLAGLPIGLLRTTGPPWPDQLPERAALRAWIEQPLTPPALITAVATLLWITWALTVLAMIGDLAAWTWTLTRTRVRERRVRWQAVPRLRMPDPVEATSAVVLGTVAVTTAAPATSAAATSSAATSSAAHLIAAAMAPPDRYQPLVDAASAIPAPVVAHERACPVHVVAAGDTLWDIADDRLGDPSRWPEIWTLNRGRYFAHIDHTLTDPDEIFPEEDLCLPADDASPQPHPPATPPAGSQPDGPAGPGPGSEPGPGGDDGTPTPVPSTPGPPIPGPPMPGPSAPAASTAGPGSGQPAIPPGAAEEGTAAAGDGPGVSLPSGGWVDPRLAAVIAAAAALVWALRRRRYTRREPRSRPRADDPDLRALPAAVTRIRHRHRFTTARADAAGPADSAKSTGAENTGTDVPDQNTSAETVGTRTGRQPVSVHEPAPLADGTPGAPDPAGVPWPPAGLGLTGPGADAAARGFLVAALAGTAPTRPGEPAGRVVMPSRTAQILLGAAAAHPPPTPGLAIAADLDDAMDLLESHILYRSRLRDRATGTAPAATTPGSTGSAEPAAPIVLVAAAPVGEDRTRLAAVLVQGRSLDIRAILLGGWPAGRSIHIATDGTTTPSATVNTPLGVDGGTVDSGSRVTVLTASDTVDLLTTLAEAHNHTGADTAPSPQPGTHRPAPPARHQPAQSGPVPTPGPQGPPAGDGTGNDRVPAAPSRVPIAVLGRPHVVGADPARALRAKSLELLVYLAARDGIAGTEAILDDLLPDAPASKAPHRLYTYVSDLRGTLRHTGGPGSYLTHPGRRYHLNPDTIDADLWRMRAALRDAEHATDPDRRIDALRRAVTAYTGPLADGMDYEWIEPYRESVRRQFLDAALALADALNDRPAEALAVLHTAIGHNPHDEPLYRAAMRAHAARGARGDTDAIHALRDELIRRLAEIDTEPETATVTLADQLTSQPHPNRPHRHPPAPPAPGAAA